LVLHLQSDTLTVFQVASQDQFDIFDIGAVALATKVLEHNFDLTFTAEITEALYQALHSIAEAGLSRNKYVSKICTLGRAALAANTRNNVGHAAICRKVRSVLFFVTAEGLLSAFKRAHRMEGYVNDLAAIDFLVALLEEEIRFDSDAFALAYPAVVQKLVRSALKHAIHDGVEEENIDLSARSLKLVRRLLTYRVKDEEFQLSKKSVEPADVFLMVTSHSRFKAMMSRGRSGDRRDDDRLALVLLMHTCVELSPVSISVDAHVWKLLWSATTASLGKLDNAIFRFGSFCSNLAGDSSVLPFLDEIRCLGGEHRPAREGRRWDWLLDGLDVNRIHATISCFPVDDAITLRKERCANDPQSPVLVSDSIEDEKMELDIPYSCIYASQSEAAATSINGRVRDRKACQRYSPAFLLPLVLGALHSCTTGEDVQETRPDELAGGTSGLTKSFYSSSQLAAMAKRLCDKGVPGLCLASLASTCEKVRAFSVSILGLLLNACNSEEARAMPSWRERPQIVMLLSSLQRAYVLERAKLSGTGMCIPILPTLVSTFLARSSMSISKPEDSLYVPLNRYFLKSEAEHGAFQDMSRLPGFIALFCSAGDDPIQSRKERIWALNHVCDGFLDPSSYRMVASCHAPELLLTSMENIRLTSFPDEMKTTEYVLILDTIKTFLDVGGRSSAAHLIDKIGLLSWLCSLCTAHAVTETFPVDAARVKVLELMEAAMCAVSRNSFLQRPTVLDEACTLLLPVINLSRISTSDKRRIAAISKAAMRTLESISDVLQLLCSAKGSRLPVQHVAGLDLGSTMVFLRSLPTDLMRDGISNICNLPCNVDAGESLVDVAGDFCCFLLEWQAAVPMAERGELSGNILRRVVHIAALFRGDFGGERNQSMVHALLSSRSCYHTSHENCRLWAEALELLRLHIVDGTIEAELAADVLNRANRNSVA
jgi:Nucleolar pre-ribosomal-associated protein 1